jgi:hypothetical protein
MVIETKDDPRVKAVEYLHSQIVGFNTRMLFGGLLYELAVRAFKSEAQIAAKDAVIAACEVKLEALQAECIAKDAQLEVPKKEVGAVLDMIHGAIHVREGAGDENIYASLAVSVAKQERLIVELVKALASAIDRIKGREWDADLRAALAAAVLPEHAPEGSK